MVLVHGSSLSASDRRYPGYNTAPNAHTSLRLSTVRPFACSGDMYAAVPRIIPACVIAGVVIVGDCDIRPRGQALVRNAPR